VSGTFKSIPGACVAASFLVIPSLIFGFVVSLFYKFFIAGIVGTLFWIPFFETVRAVVVTAFGGGLLGTIAVGGPTMITASGFGRVGRMWILGVVLATLVAVLGCAVRFGLLSYLEISYLDMFGPGFGWIDALAFGVGGVGAAIGVQPEQ